MPSSHSTSTAAGSSLNADHSITPFQEVDNDACEKLSDKEKPKTVVSNSLLQDTADIRSDSPGGDVAKTTAGLNSSSQVALEGKGDERGLDDRG
jgi:hypothetical protein